MRGGRIFKVNVNINGKPIKASQLEQVIVDIKTMCVEKSGQGIGYMTCDERTSWAKVSIIPMYKYEYFLFLIQLYYVCAHLALYPHFYLAF